MQTLLSGSFKTRFLKVFVSQTEVITLGVETFAWRNFRVEKLSRKEKCTKFCAFRVDKLSRMDPIGKSLCG